MALCFPSCLRLPPAAFAVFGFHSPALAMSALTENAPLPAPFSLSSMTASTTSFAAPEDLAGGGPLPLPGLDWLARLALSL